MGSYAMFSVPLFICATLCGWASGAEAQEQKCSELESACICSEPFNTQSYVLAGGGEWADPDDSPDFIECGQSNAAAWYPAADLATSAESGMPGENQVDYVWRHDAGTGIAHVHGNRELQDSTKRLCIRHYLRLSPNYFDNGCDGGKYMDINPEGPYQVQMGSSGGAGFVWWSPWGGQFSQNFGTGNLTMEECAGEWCRFEGCISGDFAGGTGSFFKEARITRLSDGALQYFERENMGTTSPGLLFSWLWIANNFRGNDALTCNPSTNRPDPTSWREVSHAMQAEWPFDQEGLFIGPAYEVEGGGGPSTLGQPGQPLLLQP